MSTLTIFLYEWKHFVRNPFKIVAVLLFIIAGVYGLHNGYSLYQNHITEIAKIKETVDADKQKYLRQYEEGKMVNEDRPWINMSMPFWAIWYTPTYHLKTPSPAMVYSIGQAEQYGFYKRITFWASPYDADMAEEIANPERLQTGTLDFAFVILFLLPLLLLILLYNIKSSEAEQGFLPLIEVQAASKNSWLLVRLLFYCLLSALVMAGLLIYGAMLTDVFKTAGKAFGQMLLYTMLYLAFWSVIFFFILRKGNSILGNTLQMVGIWLLFAFVIPAIVHQVVSTLIPTNLMTDFIEVRDTQQDLYANDSLFQQKLIDLFPEIVNSPVYGDSTKIDLARNQSASALVNELNKESIAPIEQENQEKNSLIQSTYWFNPVTFFQNQLNSVAQTHYNDYQAYRNNIQALIDKRAAILVKELWNDTKVDKEKYLEYNKTLSIL
jgi:ABC-2 type transport system permease protein